MNVMTKILYKDLEISNSCDDLQWMDAMEIAREVVDNLPQTYRAMFVVANNLNWQGRSGYMLDVIPAAEDLWTKIAGWGDADWTLRIEVIKPTLIRAKAYSHDTPTGGERLVKFLNGNGMYAMMRNHGWSKREIVLQLNDMGYTDSSTLTIEQIKDILEIDVHSDDLLALLRDGS